MIRMAGRPARIGHRADGSSAFSVNALAQYSTLSASKTTLQSGKTILLTLNAKDASGTPLSVGGETVTFTAMSPDGLVGELTVGAVTDVGNGTYTSIVTGGLAKFSPNTLSATIAGGAVQTAMPAINVWDVPSVSTIAPTRMTTTGGSLVTVSGSSFNPATTVKIGANSLSTLTVVNATTAIGYAPSGSAGTVNVVAITFGSNGTLTNGFTYFDTIFQSEFDNSTGTSVAALTDGSKWDSATANGGTMPVSGDPIISVVNAASSNLTDWPTTNALRVSRATVAPPTGTGFAWCEKDGLWAAPANGESRYYRAYLRVDITTDTNVAEDAHHPLEAQDGLSFSSGDIYDWKFTTDASNKIGISFGVTQGLGNPWPYHKYVLATAAGSRAQLDTGRTYRLEWSLTRTAADTYTINIRVYDNAGDLVGEADSRDWRTVGSPYALISANDRIVDDARVSALRIGTNGGYWQNTTDQYFYWGAVMVRSDDWCGAYS